jgi:anti-sigma regulatory factor (Ser/Thr protein kinase)
MPRAATSRELVPCARFWVRDVVRRAAVAAVDPETVALVVSELVTNALVHASQPVDVAVDVDADRMRVEVWDSSPRASACRRTGPPRSDAVGGWGLEIVNRLSDDWGVDRSDDRKCVWAVFGTSRPPLV